MSAFHGGVVNKSFAAFTADLVHEIVSQTEQMRAQGVHHTIVQAEMLQEGGVNQKVCDIVLGGGSVGSVIKMAQTFGLSYSAACIQMSSVCLMEALARHQKMDMEKMTKNTCVNLM